MRTEMFYDSKFSVALPRSTGPGISSQRGRPPAGNLGDRHAINGGEAQRGRYGPMPDVITPEAYPTVLVAAEDSNLRQFLKQSLESDGVHVLEAEGPKGALKHVVSHSRPIHILLADIDTAEAGSMPLLKTYRPSMHVIIVEHEATYGLSGVLSAADALKKARELLELPKSRSAGV